MELSTLLIVKQCNIVLEGQLKLAYVRKKGIERSAYCETVQYNIGRPIKASISPEQRKRTRCLFVKQCNIVLEGQLKLAYLRNKGIEHAAYCETVQYYIGTPIKASISPEQRN